MDRQPTIAVVGARKAQKVSEEKAKEFSYQLAIGARRWLQGERWALTPRPFWAP